MFVTQKIKKKTKFFSAEIILPARLAFSSYLLTFNYAKNNVLAQSNATFLWLAGKSTAVFVDKI